MSSPDLELIHLVKQYGATTAVDQIDLRIASGSYCCLLGPSGCGKSTTLRMIAGHESVTSGDILLDNRNITDLPAAARGTAMMFQSFALFPHLSRARQRGLQPEDAGRRSRPSASARAGAAGARRAWATWPSASRPSSRAASSSAWRWRAP